MRFLFANVCVPVRHTGIVWCHSLRARQAGCSSSVVCAAIWWHNRGLNKHGCLSCDGVLVAVVLLERVSIAWWPSDGIFMRLRDRGACSTFWRILVFIFNLECSESIGELLHLSSFVLLWIYEFTLKPLSSENWARRLHLTWRLRLFVLVDAKQLLLWSLVLLFLLQYLFYLCLWQLLQRLNHIMETSWRWKDASLFHVFF